MAKGREENMKLGLFPSGSSKLPSRGGLQGQELLWQRGSPSHKAGLSVARGRRLLEEGRPRSS